MKHTALLVMALWMTLLSSANAQSADERIAQAMNNSDWFKLDAIYRSTPKDSINTFLEIFSRCLIGNRLNRPDVSIPAFDELLTTQTSQLDITNLVNSSIMYSMDLSRVGHHAKAASVLNAITEAIKQHLDSATINTLSDMANRYSALSRHTPYKLSFNGNETGRIPFSITPVGPASKSAILMTLDSCSINGHNAVITFDTGAGANVISDSLAQEYGLVPLNANVKAMGFGLQHGYYAIAPELRLGNITITDVPFYVLDITSNNAEADRYITPLQLIIGSELMLQLKDVTIDFVNKEITSPASAPVRTDALPNICFSSGMNLLTQGFIMEHPILMCIDSGDASHGTLSPDFFTQNKDYITAHARADSVRLAGIGGFSISPCYELPNVTLTLDRTQTTIPEITVLTDNTATVHEHKCNLGLKSLMLYGKIRFNLVDMTLHTSPKPALSAATITHTDTPHIQYTHKSGMTPLQVAAAIALGIYKQVKYPYSPDMPDL